MTSFSSKEAQRRFHVVLTAAELGPVIIERHGRPRAAVVSMRRFEIYEALWRKEMDTMALENLQGALSAANEGKFEHRGACSSGRDRWRVPANDRRRFRRQRRPV